MTKKDEFIEKYFKQTSLISSKINTKSIENLVIDIFKVRKNNGRIFFLGVGGSAGNCSHAVNDFRKLCNIECYAPTDNVSELTARINDEGWENSFVDWLKVNKLKKNDAIFVFSVGGGNKKFNVSVNLIKAIDYAKKTNTKVFGIVGKNDGYLYKKANQVVLVPNVNDRMITPFSEAFQAVIWHCLVSHPLLQVRKTKW
tara:strand:+ start:302 stop:898 length:597 start_codon:yes stop_codon:yes gene_type:complete